jgi:hypothetical protein
LISITKELIAPPRPAANFTITYSKGKYRHHLISACSGAVASIGSTVGVLITYLKAPDARWKKKTPPEYRIHHIRPKQSKATALQF